MRAEPKSINTIVLRPDHPADGALLMHWAAQRESGRMDVVYHSSTWANGRIQCITIGMQEAPGEAGHEKG